MHQVHAPGAGAELKLAASGQHEAGHSPGMLLEVGELSEGLITVGAVVGLDAQVDAQVLGQVGGVGKGFGAVRALVGLGLCVRLGVDLHLRLGEKGQRAYLTPVGKRQVHTRKIPAPTPSPVPGDLRGDLLHQRDLAPGTELSWEGPGGTGRPPAWAPSNLEAKGPPPGDRFTAGWGAGLHLTGKRG